MFSRKSLLVLMTVAAAGVVLAQSQPAPTPKAPATATPATATPAPQTGQVEGGAPRYIRPETPQQRRDRLGTNENPRPNHAPTKQFFRFGKQYHIERFASLWASD